ncbi:hypothetical protein ACFY19_15865 [Streptosporangium saharense]|uniref:Type IV secretory pathway VirB2 component (Pilin) n=1 Tax=Streptosporangium saharense TaxID=1706840 RepID=A0A7W7QNK2_9ACTN|nr:hypothetical protein [Streptosporangium saharense]MBB4916900.1 type IV secretory pathway VirB2 component (pilin) [Streptosporangium saharense]
MVRTVLGVVGALLALYLVFAIVIPALFGLLKFVLVLGVVALIVVAAVTIVSKSSK